MTLPINSKMSLLEKMAERNTTGIVQSLRAGILGKVTADNIDGRTISAELRMSGGNKDYHYTASTYITERFDLVSSF